VQILDLSYVGFIMAVVMKRTTIMLPRGLKSKAEREATRSEVSLGEFIRASMEEKLLQQKSKARNRFFTDAFTFVDDGPPGVAANTDKYVLGMRLEDYLRTQTASDRAASKRAKREPLGSH
jgi:hypothetical protein